MKLLEIIVAIEAIAVLYVGYILKKQSKSQQKIIGNLEKYTSIIDIEKLKQYDSFREEAVMHKAGVMIADGLHGDIEKLTTEKVNDLAEQYKEYMIFAWDILYSNSPEIREVLLNQFFPKNRKAIERIIRDKDKNSSS